MLNIENPSTYWLDNKTFILAFDGGIDEDGDEYSYQARYCQDTNTFIFECWYEGYITPAGFSCEEEEYIRSIMLDKIAEQQEIRSEGNKQNAPASATLDQQMI